MKNQNWFNAMVSFHNTIRHIQRTWNVPREIAKRIQHMAATSQSQKNCDDIAKASQQLCNQVGF